MGMRNGGGQSSREQFGKEVDGAEVYLDGRGEIVQEVDDIREVVIIEQYPAERFIE